MLSGAVPSLSLSAAMLQLQRYGMRQWSVETSGGKSCSLQNGAVAEDGDAVMLLGLGQGEVAGDECLGRIHKKAQREAGL